MGYRNIIKHIRKGKLILPFFVLGVCGLVIESFFTALTGVNVPEYKYISFMTQSSLWSILVYGTGGIIISILNEIPKIYNLSMRLQVLIFGSCIILTELLYGIALNISILQLDIWHYNSTFNILHQIDLLHSICWYAGVPFFIWVYDTVIGYGLYRETWYYNVLDNYKELFTLK